MSEYARGLEGVIANESSLSNVIGNIGELSYVGYHIDDLVENCCYEEIIFLLHHNRLPNRKELATFSAKLRNDRDLPAPVIDFLKTAPKDASPMDVLRTAVSMLGLYDKRATIENLTSWQTPRSPSLSVRNPRPSSPLTIASATASSSRPSAPI